MVKVNKDEGGMMNDEFGCVRVVREKEVRLYECERSYVNCSRSWLTVMIFIPSYSLRSSK